MKKGKYGICGIALGLFCLAGCASNDIVERVEGEHLAFAMYEDLRDVNPHLYNGAMYAQNILFDGLVDFIDDEIVGALAESFFISEDETVYTFHIRENAFFSDGTVCDAFAIAKNFEALLENAVYHDWIVTTNVIESVVVLDTYTLVITLTQPYYFFLTELSMIRPFAMVSPDTMIEGSSKNGLTEMIGTGAYTIKEHIEGEYVTFEANPYYWGEPPEIPLVTMKLLPENQTRLLALEKGEIDIIYGKSLLDADTLKHYENHAEFEVQLSEPIATRHLVFNTTHDILNDIGVRLALSHATNKEEIAEYIFYGMEEVAHTLYSETLPFCDIGLTSFSYDIGEAEALLTEAGWQKNAEGILEKEGEVCSIEFLYRITSVVDRTIAEYLQAEYLKLGVRLHLVGAEEQSYKDRMQKGEFELAFNISWGTPYDPQSSIASMTMPVHGDYMAQLGLLNKAEIDLAIEEILICTDEQRRQALFTFVLTELHEQAVYIPLTYECNKALYRNELEHVAFTNSQYEIPFHKISFGN